MARPFRSVYRLSTGPPTERHSVAAVILGRGPNDELSPAEVSGFARVQQAVGKRAVVATAPLATEDTAATSTGGAVEVLSAHRDDGPRPTGTAAGQKTLAPRQRGKPATPAQTAATPAHLAAAAAANDGVRYVTLQFHSVCSRA